ncbi:MAG: EF-P lysine aminoacylase EpmA [bacterium]|nr:EF-P lysine aminoacylase EpmA [bacterium]
MKLKNIQTRSEVVTSIRAWFDAKGFTEVHTPRLVGLPGQEPHLEPFWMEVQEQGGTQKTQNVALITSPEYAMKRLLAEGMEKIYDVGPCFRNGEPWDGSHDPEFLMLEWYQKSISLSELMDQTEEMVRGVAERMRIAPSALSRSWRRMTVAEAFREYLDMDLESMLEDFDEDEFFKLFLTHIEPKLSKNQPTFLYRYPVQLASLAKPCDDDPRFAERVELYIGGLEIANGFEELTDEDEQRRRFLEEQKTRKESGKKTWPLDESFLSALPKMGPTAGIAFGVDRLVMVFTGSKSINDVIPFSARERFSNEMKD